MIHDFATLSKSNPQEELRPPRRVAEVALPYASKQGQLRVALIALSVMALVAIGIYTRAASKESTSSEFSPGMLETQEYQRENILSGTIAESAVVFDTDLPSLEVPVAGSPELVESPMQASEAREQVAFEAAVGSEQSAESGFGFYDSLQASTWDVPVQKGVYLTEEDMKRATYTYMLQAASMRNHGDALALVRKLKEMGMNATYTKSGGSFGDTWYRVNVGPFSDVSVMNKAEDRLVAMRMMPLKRRIK